MGAIPISSTKESYGKEINVAGNNYNTRIGFNLCHTLYWIWLSLMGLLWNSIANEGIRENG